MINKTDAKGLIKTLEKHSDSVGKERDKLMETADEIDALISSCDEAYENLQAAIAALSEYA